METPPRTATAEPRTSATGEPTDSTRKTYKTTAEWTKQKYQDRQAIKKHIDKKIASSAKFSRWDTRQRWIFLQNEREHKLRERETGRKERNGKTSSTMRKLWPEKYDVEEERGWLWKTYETHLPSDPDARWDDIVEEEKQGKRGVQRVNYNEDSDEDEDDEEVPSEFAVKAEKIDEESGGRFKTGHDEGEEIRVGMAGDEEVGEVRRIWRVVDNSLVAWPLSEDSEQTELESKILKDAMKRIAEQRLRAQVGDLWAEQMET